MKDYTIRIPGFKEQELIWRAGFWKNSFLVNGQILKGTGKKNSDYLVKNDQGEVETIRANVSLGETIPSFTHKDETYNLAPPVSTGQKIFAAVLHIPLFAGGALGGICCALGYMTSLSFFRSERPSWLRYAMVAASAFGAWMVYFVLSAGVQSLIG